MVSSMKDSSSEETKLNKQTMVSSMKDSSSEETKLNKQTMVSSMKDSSSEGTKLNKQTMVSSMKDSSSEETKSANSEFGASWQQDSDEEDLMSSEGSSRRPYKRKRTSSSLPVIHKKDDILAPTYPNVPVVNSTLSPNPVPWMCPPWVQNPWMYAQQMPMPPPWTTPAVMSYNAPWMYVSPTQQDRLKDYGGHGSQVKKADKRVKVRKHVKNVSNVQRKAKVRKVVKLKKKRGNHLSLTETTERLQASLQASQSNQKKPSSRLVGSFSARLSAIENRQNEIEEQLTRILASTAAVSEAIDGLQSKLIEIVVNHKDN